MIIKTVTREDADRIEGGSIRIGSLIYYRNIEDHSRQDFDEGVPSTYLSGDGRHFSADEINNAQIAAGSNFRAIGEWTWVIQGEGAIKIDSDINMHVFCASSVNAQANAPDLAKFGKCQFEILDPDAFSEEIAMSLLSAYQRGQLEPRGDMDSISHRHSPVEYDTKESTYVSQSDKGLMNVDLHCAFTKPPQFASESEYRFVWVPFSNAKQLGCALPYGRKYVDLHIPGLGAHIRWISR